MEVTRFCNHSFISDFINEESIVMDLGLNNGEFSEQILQHYNCTVFGAEPVPALYSKLPKLDRLFAYPLAISGDVRTIDLRLNATRCASTLDSLKESKGEDIKVECTTLEDFISKYARVKWVDLVKMDIEGAEIEVLSNSIDNTLKKIGMLTVEFHDFLDSNLKTKVNAIHKKMRILGFDRINWSLDNTDVLYINRGAHQLTLGQKLYLLLLKCVRGTKRRLRRRFGMVVITAR